jgi:hypothetical protein
MTSDEAREISRRNEVELHEQYGFGQTHILCAELARWLDKYQDDPQSFLRIVRRRLRAIRLETKTKVKEAS